MVQHVRNILKVYRRATTDDIANGVEWYSRAKRYSHAIADRTGIHVNTVIGVMAALSPNNKWDRNVANARDLIAGFLNGDGVDDIKVSTYNAMKKKAWSILEQMPDHEGVIDILNGQKIVSFYRNIMGDDTCTVDGHAKNIYYGERHGLTDDKTNVGKKEYKTISEAYVKAGKRVRVNGRSLKAFEIQAITWVVWRRIHNIK
jgi:hypothetical protein